MIASTYRPHLHDVLIYQLISEVLYLWTTLLRTAKDHCSWDSCFGQFFKSLVYKLIGQTSVVRHLWANDTRRNVAMFARGLPQLWFATCLQAAVAVYRTLSIDLQVHAYYFASKNHTSLWPFDLHITWYLSVHICCRSQLQTTQPDVWQPRNEDSAHSTVFISSHLLCQWCLDLFIVNADDPVMNPNMTSS